MGHSLGVKAVVVAGVVAVVVIAVALVAYFLILKPHTTGITINAPYAFIVNENGQWFIEWYDESGNLHTLGPYGNLNEPGILQAVGVVEQFDQEVVPQHMNYQPLAWLIVIGANDTKKQGVIIIPTSGSTIQLSKVNPGYYTLVVVPQQYESQFMEALDVGYKLSATVGSQGANYLQYNDPQVWKLVLETIDLQHYSQPPIDISGGAILETNNGTLIPWGSLYGTSQYSYGNNLPFIKQLSTFYNGNG